LSKSTSSSVSIDSLIKKINPDLLPKHIAIIMDGNGRWAKNHRRSRVRGHFKGASVISDIAQCCSDLKVGYLTLYAFSQENWSRPKSEINALMELLILYLKKELKKFMANEIRFQTIGDIGKLPTKCRNTIEQTIAATAKNRGMVFTLALSYSGRDEILRAVNKIIERKSPETMDATTFEQYLDTAAYPDPDLLIRTSGEMRISNFMLWQLAYSEIYVTPTLWPDFSPQHLVEAILDFQTRHRRFGGIKDHVGPQPEAP
jgi:undecaprenyl diphosphate synthase